MNLTAADTVIHYDPWWNPALENQATDRAHRIGQDKPVFVLRLITAGSIEEKMETLKRCKQALADGILGASTNTATARTEADLEMLFAERPRAGRSSRRDRREPGGATVGRRPTKRSWRRCSRRLAN